MKLTFDEALDRISDGRMIKRGEVQASALKRTVWVASNGLPGCLNDNATVHTSKYAAVDSHLWYFAQTGDMEVPHGMASALRGAGDTCVFQHEGYLYRVEKMRLIDLI